MSKQFSVYVETSGGAVPTVKTVKTFVDIMAKMGFNRFYLGCSDTFEIKNEPYFGYMRGRYSVEEFKEIDSYCVEKGITFVPNIQTLSHQNIIPAYQRFKPLLDYGNTLLCDNPETYEFIEEMFESLSKSISSKTVHIGMDEAFQLGSGNYLRKFGYKDRKEILLSHLNKVNEIAHKYGFTCEMWGDMFFHMVKRMDGEYDMREFHKYKDYMPKDIKLVHWRYDNTNTAAIENEIKLAKSVTDNLAYAAGLWEWTGFAPDNDFSVRNAKFVCDKCSEYGVDDIMLTVWKDDNGAGSIFTILPAMYVWSEIYFGRATCVQDIDKKKFYDIVGVEFDDFMLMDKLNKPYSDRTYAKTNNKSFLNLYNDVLIGLLDSLISDGIGEEYKKLTKTLGNVKENGFSYVFNTLKALSCVLEIKSELGKRIRRAYLQKDTETLLSIAKTDIPETIKRIDELYDAYIIQFEKDNKGFGIEITLQRLGGLKQRLIYVAGLLNRYVEGKIETIDVLDEKQLPFGFDLNATEDTYFLMCWRNIVTNGKIN